MISPKNRNLEREESRKIRDGREGSQNKPDVEGLNSEVLKRDQKQVCKLSVGREANFDDTPKDRGSWRDREVNQWSLNQRTGISKI